MMTNSEGEALYAAAYWRRDVRKGWIQEISHFHAPDYPTAKGRFVFAHRSDPSVWLIAVGPAIAFFVVDNQGMVLSA